MLVRLSPQPIARATKQERAQLRFRARMLHSKGQSHGRVAERLCMSGSEAYWLVNHVPKAGPLSLRTTVRGVAA